MSPDNMHKSIPIHSRKKTVFGQCVCFSININNAPTQLNSIIIKRLAIVKCVCVCVFVSRKSGSQSCRVACPNGM